jgi:hypothetical protein
MKSKDIFGIVVRVVGLLALLSGLGGAYAAFSVFSFGRLLLRALLYGIPYLAVSLYLLRGAPHLVRFAYPDESEQSSKDNA